MELVKSRLEGVGDENKELLVQNRTLTSQLNDLKSSKVAGDEALSKLNEVCCKLKEKQRSSEQCVPTSCPWFSMHSHY